MPASPAIRCVYFTALPVVNVRLLTRMQTLSSEYPHKKHQSADCLSSPIQMQSLNTVNTDSMRVEMASCGYSERCSHRCKHMTHLLWNALIVWEFGSLWLAAAAFHTPYRRLFLGHSQEEQECLITLLHIHKCTDNLSMILEHNRRK